MSKCHGGGWEGLHGKSRPVLPAPLGPLWPHGEQHSQWRNSRDLFLPSQRLEVQDAGVGGAGISRGLSPGCVDTCPPQPRTVVLLCVSVPVSPPPPRSQTGSDPPRRTSFHRDHLFEVSKHSHCTLRPWRLGLGHRGMGTRSAPCTGHRHPLWPVILGVGPAAMGVSTLTWWLSSRHACCSLTG